MIGKIKSSLALSLAPCVLLALLLSSASLAQVQDAGGYVIKDSQYLGYGTQDSPWTSDLHWIDNERVLFRGYKPGDMIAEPRRTYPRLALYIWNASMGEVRKYAESGEQDGVCFVKGYIRSTFERDGVLYAHFGPLGKEREQKVDMKAMKDEVLAVSPVSCREYNPKQLKQRYGGILLPLLEPGEHLDRYVGQQYDLPLRYFLAGSSEPIELSLIPNRNVLTIPRYSDFLDQYVFLNSRSKSAPDVSDHLWLLDRRGRVTEVVLPAGPWMAGTTRAMPTRKGWFLISTAATFKPPGNAGGYFISGNDVRRLVIGFPYGFAVSPDGCKVAISISGYTRQQMLPPNIKMIDVCSKGD